MIGTIANCSTILIGSFIGSRMRSGLKPTYKAVMMQAMGLAATMLGVNSVALNMPKSVYPVLFIVCLALGGLLGQFLNLDTRFNGLAQKVSGGSNLAQGLSTAVLLFCVGTLSILGPIESAINQNHTYLFTNAALDLVTSMVLAATFGFGIALSAVAVLLWQGGIYMLAGVLAPFLTPELMVEISVLGGILIFSSGISILEIKNIKTINLLPCLLFPPLFILIKSFF